MNKNGTKLRRRTSIYLIILFAVMLCLAIILLVKNYTVSQCSADIDDDGIQDHLSITGRGPGRFGDNLKIVTRSGQQIYDFHEWKPWKVQTADVDGDGDLEISIGVYKTTRFDPEYKKRPFIYNWDEDGISPKWLGSSLARPFDDYIFADVNGDGMDNIISIEDLAEGGKAVNSYRWKGFGFLGLAQSKSFDNISEIQASQPDENGRCKINAKVKLAGRWQWITLAYHEDTETLE